MGTAQNLKVNLGVGTSPSLKRGRLEGEKRQMLEACVHRSSHTQTSPPLLSETESALYPVVWQCKMVKSERFFPSCVSR